MGGEAQTSPYDRCKMCEVPTRHSSFPRDWNPCPNFIPVFLESQWLGGRSIFSWHPGCQV